MKFKFEYIFVLSYILLLLTGVASAGTSTQWDIYEAQTLTDTSVAYSADICIYPGGSLTLNNSSIIFENSVDCQYGIKIYKGNTTATTGGKLVTRNGSSISGLNYSSRSFIWSEYSYPVDDKTPTIQLSDSTFSYLGNTSSGTAGIEILSSNSNDTFVNCTIQHCYNGLYFKDGGAGCTVKNCTINDINSSAIFVKYNPIQIINCNISNMKFGVYGQYTSGMKIIGNRLTAGTRQVGSYCVDILGENSGNPAKMDRFFEIRDNIMYGNQRCIVLNIGVRDGIIDNNTIRDSNGVGIGSNFNVYNMTITNNNFTNIQDGIIVVGSNWTIQDNTFTNISQNYILNNSALVHKY